MLNKSVFNCNFVSYSRKNPIARKFDYMTLRYSFKLSLTLLKCCQNFTECFVGFRSTTTARSIAFAGSVRARSAVLASLWPHTLTASTAASAASPTCTIPSRRSRCWSFLSLLFLIFLSKPNKTVTRRSIGFIFRRYLNILMGFVPLKKPSHCTLTVKFRTVKSCHSPSGTN